MEHLTKDDVIAWFDTFKFAYENTLDLFNYADRKKVARFLTTDPIAMKYFAYLEPDYMAKVESRCALELGWARKGKL